MLLCTKKFVFVYSNWLDFEHETSLGYGDQLSGLETYQGATVLRLFQCPYC